MPPDLVEVQRWLRKAQNDWSAARKIMASNDPETDVAAFHCQQAVEKMLKAFLVFREVQFQKVHDLGRLLDHCAAADANFEQLRDAVLPLNIYAVAFRYPGPAEPSQDQVTSALDVVGQVWAFLETVLPKDALP